MLDTVTPRNLDEIDAELAHIKMERDTLARRIAELAAYGWVIDRDDIDATAYRVTKMRITALYDELGDIRKAALATLVADRG